jgi:hypothetical protein
MCVITQFETNWQKNGSTNQKVIDADQRRIKTLAQWVSKINFVQTDQNLKIFFNINSFFFSQSLLSSSI